MRKLNNDRWECTSVAEAFFGIEIWKGTKLLESERYTYIKSAHLLTWRQMVAIEEMHSLIEENRGGICSILFFVSLLNRHLCEVLIFYDLWECEHESLLTTTECHSGDRWIKYRVPKMTQKNGDYDTVKLQYNTFQHGKIETTRILWKEKDYIQCNY